MKTKQAKSQFTNVYCMQGISRSCRKHKHNTPQKSVLRKKCNTKVYYNKVCLRTGLLKLIHSFKKCLLRLSTFYMLGTVPDVDGIKNIHNPSVLMTLIIVGRGQSIGKRKKKKIVYCWLVLWKKIIKVIKLRKWAGGAQGRSYNLNRVVKLDGDIWEGDIWAYRYQ